MQSQSVSSVQQARCGTVYTHLILGVAKFLEYATKLALLHACLLAGDGSDLPGRSCRQLIQGYAYKEIFIPQTMIIMRSEVGGETYFLITSVLMYPVGPGGLSMGCTFYGCYTPFQSGLGLSRR
jgi:hypothetical protein